MNFDFFTADSLVLECCSVDFAEFHINSILFVFDVSCQ